MRQCGPKPVQTLLHGAHTVSRTDRYASNRALHKIEGKYPRLLRLMQWAALLNDSESSACLRDYVDGNEYSSEAVHHYGGATKVVQRAVALRTNAFVREEIRNLKRSYGSN